MTKTSSGRIVMTLAVLTALGSVASNACRADGGGGGPAVGADDAGVAQQTPCQKAFGADCGAACGDGTPCAMGLHCTDGVCGADCIEAADCAGGECSAEGRCMQLDAGVDSSIVVDPPDIDPTETDPNEAPTCIEGQVMFEAVKPQVWMLLDQSGSMSSLLGLLSRWEALGAVIVGDPADAADRGVVGAFEDRVAFGAVFYTSGYAVTGCILDLETVALATNNYGDIRQRYAQLGPEGGTPTADSIAATVAVAAGSDLTGGPKILLLATDGVPGDCSLRDETPTVEVEKEVQKAYSKQIQTFVVSIATETDAPHMQRVANLGVGLAADADPPAPYYTAENQAELALAFNTILEDVPRSCVFSLNGEVDAENADQGMVTLAGVTLVFGDENGWVLERADQVELVGDACAQIQAGEEDLEITFPCEVFTPVPR
jgi:hypothetical protein